MTSVNKQQSQRAVVFGCVLSMVLVLGSGCDSNQEVAIDAVVFYRVFSLGPTREGCRVNVAITVPSTIGRVPSQQGGLEVIVHPKQLVRSLREVSHSQTSGVLVLPGEVVAVRDGVAYFEPTFSPVHIAPEFCSELTMEEGRVKHLQLRIKEASGHEGAEVSSVEIGSIEPGDVLFIK